MKFNFPKLIFILLYLLLKITIQLATENMTLTRKLQELEKQLDERDSKVNTMQRSNQTDGVELMTLRKACQLQKQDLENMEAKLEEFRHEIERTR